MSSATPETTSSTKNWHHRSEKSHRATSVSGSCIDTTPLELECVKAVEGELKPSCGAEGEREPQLVGEIVKQHAALESVTVLPKGPGAQRAESDDCRRLRRHRYHHRCERETEVSSGKYEYWRSSPHVFQKRDSLRPNPSSNAAWHRMSMRPDNIGGVRPISSHAQKNAAHWSPNPDGISAKSVTYSALVAA